MKQIIITLVFFISTLAFSQNKNAKSNLKVDGVCGMCKTRIEKAAIKTKGVKSAIWDIESHILKLIYDERKTTLGKVSNNIAKVGHDTELKAATDEAYNAINDCCKYRDLDAIKEHKHE